MTLVSEQSNELRPRTFEEFIGQERVVRALKVALAAARHRGEALEHVLFFGPPGMGKTTLSMIIAHEMGGGYRGVTGPTLTHRGDLQQILSGLGEKGVLFIDEIHRMAKPPSELLYPAMEDFVMDFQLGKGTVGSRVYQLRIPRFTLVGATTRSGGLLRPLRQRFGLVKELEFYQTGELASIARMAAAKLDVEIQDKAAWTIAERSRGTARIVGTLLRRCRDFLQASEHKEGGITSLVVERAMELEGVDARGLTGLDRRVMSVMAEQYDGGPVGVGALANTLQVEVPEITEIVEPFLLYSGLVKLTSRGRMLTTEGMKEVKRWQ